jgi:hypothetical protein
MKRSVATRCNEEKDIGEWERGLGISGAIWYEVGWGEDIFLEDRPDKEPIDGRAESSELPEAQWETETIGRTYCRL